MTDLRQAAQQALEALENSSPDQYPEDAGVFYDAITAIKEALAQPPQQQAEPTCPDCKAAVLYECVACSSNNYPPKQQAEPVQEHITHITWDERGVRTVNGIPDDAPRRKELSASEILNMMPSGIPAEYDGELMEFARAVEAKLKERNT